MYRIAFGGRIGKYATNPVAEGDLVHPVQIALFFLHVGVL